MSFAPAERVADAVLYEGYLLYPYRASSAKNRVRWQFGVVAPAAYAQADDSEHAGIQTECVVAAPPGATLRARLRFLHLQARRIEVPAGDGSGGFQRVDAIRIGDRELTAWEEGLPVVVDVPALRIDDLVSRAHVEPVTTAPSLETTVVADEAGVTRARVVRERWPIVGSLTVTAVPRGEWHIVRVRLDNLTPWAAGEALTRDHALRRSCIAAHVLLAVEGGAFVSLTDPPPGAEAAAMTCRNWHLWPVLAGPPGTTNLVLASPIILGDHPSIAPESPADLFDATEIDEILTLRVMTLTDEEKREACATDDRARRIIEQSDSLPPEVFERLHGAIRSLAPIAPPDAAGFEALVNPPGEAPPELASTAVGAATVARGSRVRLRPTRRADSMDMFLRDRTATVAGVHRDLENRVYVAVTVDDDPAAELHGGTGRFFYFSPDEIEPLDAAGQSAAGAP